MHEIIKKIMAPILIGLGALFLLTDDENLDTGEIDNGMERAKSNNRTNQPKKGKNNERKKSFENSGNGSDHYGSHLSNPNGTGDRDEFVNDPTPAPKKKPKKKPAPKGEEEDVKIDVNTNSGWSD